MSSIERTFAMLKPDVVAKPWVNESVKLDEETGEEVEHDEHLHHSVSEKIIERIQSEGFTIVQRRHLKLSKQEARRFYREHAGRPFFDGLTDFMSSGPIVALCLEKENAIADWRALLGPTNSNVAREEAEAKNPLDMEKWGIRAAFGTDGQKNAAHGSDSKYSALREVEFFFPAPKQRERALVLLKPDVVLSGRTEQAVAALTRMTDLVVVGRSEQTMSAQMARDFLEPLGEAGNVKSRVSHLLGGPCVALVLEGDNAVLKVQLALGPEKVSDALDKSPDSIRAVFGSSDETEALSNAADGSATPADAEREIALWFPNGLPVESTLALVTPAAAASSLDAIKNSLVGRGFTITAEQRVQLSKERAEAFFSSMRRRFYFGALTDFVSSGESVALVLSKAGAVETLTHVAGNEDPKRARSQQPNSLRALYGGQDVITNGVYSSGDLAVATRDIAFFFPRLLVRPVNALAEGKQGAGVLSGADAKAYLASAPAGSGTLTGVVADALTELCRAKPAGLNAVRWLGEYLLQNNPNRPRVHQVGGGIVSEPDEDSVASGSVYVSRPAAQVAAAAPQRRFPNGGAALPSQDLQGANIVFVLGGPGSGKGTQCAKIAKEFGFVHLSTGDLLRAEVATGSPKGQELGALMQSGGLVPDAAVLALLKAAMKRSGGNKFLVDGYPRALEQAFKFEQAVGAPQQVLFFDVDEETLRSRLLARGATSGRADDNAESIVKRLQVFNSSSLPVVQFYSKLGKMRTIDGRQSVEDVFAQVRQCFQPHVVLVLGGPGAGKGMQSKRAAAEFGYQHLSAGEVLEKEVARRSADGQAIQKMVANGQLVPDDLTLKLLRKAMDRSSNFKFVVEGFPLTPSQAAQFEASVALATSVVYLDAPDQVLLQRLQSRVAAQQARSKPWSRKAVKDNWDPRTLKRRVRNHSQQSPALLKRFSAAGLLRSVDASVSAEEVYSQVRAGFQPSVVFVLGGPGSGKGTQCTRIAKEFGYVHLSAGDLLRAEVARGSPEGAMIDGMIRNGQIVPVEVTLNLLRKAMLASTSDKFLVDGFPRAQDQAEAFERTVCPCDFVLFLDVPDDVLVERLKERGAAAGAARRVDDNEAAIARRIKVHHMQSMPVVDYYSRQGKMKVVQGTGHPDDVFADVSLCFQPSVVFVCGAPGSGMTTQCDRVAANFGYTHLSLPGLLSSAVERGTLLGRRAAACTAAGQEVPVALKVALLKEAMGAKGGAGGGRFIVDSFPENLEQATAFEQSVGRPKFVLFFDCPEEVMLARKLPPVAPTPEEEEDDSPAALAAKAAQAEERAAASAALKGAFTSFLANAMPVVEKYTAGGAVRVVSATPNADQVFSQVKGHFQHSLVLLVGASGSGRGELATRLGRQEGYTRVRVTQLLREEQARDTAWGRTISRCLASRRQIPTQIPLALIRRCMRQSGGERFLLDGYPRLVADGYPGVFDQLAELEDLVGPVSHCVHLACPASVREGRTRGVSREQLEAATQSYTAEKMPVVAYLEQLGKVKHVDASVDAEAVLAEVKSFIAVPTPESELFKVDIPQAMTGGAAGEGGEAQDAAAIDFEEEDF